jgi:hypothetical protein
VILSWSQLNTFCPSLFSCRQAVPSCQLSIDGLSGEEADVLPPRMVHHVAQVLRVDKEHVPRSRDMVDLKSFD